MISVNFIIAQVLGIVATLIMCVSYSAKNKKSFLFIGLLGDIVYGITFFFVGSLSAGLIALVSCVQVLFIHHYDKKDKKTPRIIALAFILSFILLGLFTMQSYWDIIPILTYIWFTIVLDKKDVNSIKYLYILPNLVLTIYDFVVMAYASALEDGFEAIYLISVLVIDFIKTRKQQTISIKSATQKESFSNFIMAKGFNRHRCQSNIIKSDSAFNSKFIKAYMRTISVKELYPPPRLASCHN